MKNDYIYNKIRLQGGAYVCDIEFREDKLTLVSSRDSDIWKTLEVFEAIPDWLDSIDITQDDINRQIEYFEQWKGLAPNTLGRFIYDAKRDNKTDEKVESNSSSDIIDGAHEVTLEDINTMKLVLHMAFSKRVICVAANEEVINKHRELLEKIIDLRAV